MSDRMINMTANEIRDQKSKASTITKSAPLLSLPNPIPNTDSTTTRPLCITNRPSHLLALLPPPLLLLLSRRGSRTTGQLQ